MKRDVRVYLQDIIDSVDKITEYTDGMNWEDFEKDTAIQDAVIRRLTVIGEASKNIPEDIREGNEEVPWKRMAGLRDVLVHSHFGVNISRGGRSSRRTFRASGRPFGRF